MLDLEALVELSIALEEAEQAVRAAPIDFVAWLPPQIAFMRHPRSDPRPALLRLGNRQGKTTTGAAELVYTCRGQGPYNTYKKAPARCALVCMNMAQSVEIQRVIWEMVGGRDNRELIAGTEFSSRTGFRGHRPVVEFKNGSSITIYANAQGAEALAGAEYELILLDEPPSREVYNEAIKRVLNTGGRVALTMTPINGPPLPWLRELTEAGPNGEPPGVVDYHFRLTPENCVSPVTGLVRRTKDDVPWDADFIRAVEASSDPISREIRVHGGWEMRTEGQWFDCFDPNIHVTKSYPDEEVQLCLGIDYAGAAREYGMCAVISAVEDTVIDGLSVPIVWTLAEVVMPGTATMDAFSGELLNVLAALGIRWHELDNVYGDIPVKTRFQESSNRQMGKAVARRLKIDHNGLRPRPLGAKEGGGSSGRNRSSKDKRFRWMYAHLTDARVRIHPRCVHLTKALQEWDYSDKHPRKDVLDAWMYGLKDIWGARNRSEVPRLLRR